MKIYYKLCDILEIVSRYSLKTIKNSFLLEENLDNESKEFEGPFLIVSDTEESEKYFLTLNISQDKFEENTDFPESWTNGFWYWRLIPLIHFLTKENKEHSLRVWAEGRVKSKGYDITFRDGPAEINLAGIKQTIEIIEKINPSRYVRFTFDEMMGLSWSFTKIEAKNYHKKHLLEIYNIIN